MLLARDYAQTLSVRLAKLVFVTLTGLVNGNRLRIDSRNTQSQSRLRRLWRSLRQPRRENSPGVPTVNRSILLAAVCASALVAASAVSAKTLVFCSEGSPENFYPGVNTTGTSFDANSRSTTALSNSSAAARKSCLASPRNGHLAGRHRLHLQPAQGREVALDVEVVQADARLQCRRHHLLDRAAVEGRQSVLQGDELEPFLLQRHGHAEAAEVGREGRRLHGQDHAQQAGSAVPRRSRDGVCGHPVEGIRRRDAEGRHAREDRPGADRHRPVLSACSTRRTRSSATRRSRSSGAARRRSTTSSSRSRRMHRCAGPSCRRANAT